MPANVEIKARVEAPDALHRRAAELADGPPRVFHQRDTFFVCPGGRLELRSFSDGSGELIYYERPDAEGPKTSRYLLAPTRAPERLRHLLTAAYGTAGEVRKTRTLLLVGQTRVHLDEVEGLGCYMEFEVVLREGQPTEDGETIATQLMERLQIPPDALVRGAYVDLLAEQRSRQVAS